MNHSRLALFCLQLTLLYGLFFLSSNPSLAVPTRKWIDHGFDDFAAGKAFDVALQSDGSLFPGPEVKPIAGESPDASVLCLAGAQNGDVYGGTCFQGLVLVKRKGEKSFSVLCRTGRMMVTCLLLQGKSLWAGTGPKGILFEIDPSSGKILARYDSGEDYIWALLPSRDARGLLVATGSAGKLLAFFDGTFSTRAETKQTHVLCLARSKNGHVLAGTSGGSMLLDLGPDGVGPQRTLFEPNQPECRSIVVDHRSGTIYLCATTPPKAAGSLKKPLPKKSKTSKKPGKGSSRAKHTGAESSPPLTGSGNDGASPGKDRGKADGTGESKSGQASPPGGTEKTPGKVDAGPSASGTVTASKHDDGPRNVVGDNGDKAGAIHAGDKAPSSAESGAAKVGPTLSPDKERKLRLFLLAARGGGDRHRTSLPTSTRPPRKVPFFDGSAPAPQAVYAIEPCGLVRTLFTSKDSVLFQLVELDRFIYVGSGDDGFIYRIDRRGTRSSRVTGLPDKQVTCLLVRPDGSLLAGCANEGNIYSVGPSAASTGCFESSVKKLPHSAVFGSIALSCTGDWNGRVRVETRSGFSVQPDDNWSPWSPCKALPDSASSLSTCPPGRFFQYRLLFSLAPDEETGARIDTGDSSSGGSPPLPSHRKAATGSTHGNDSGPRFSVDQVDVYYRPINLPPRIKSIVIKTPPVPIGSNRKELAAAAAGKSSKSSKKLASYMRRVEWKAMDPNGDQLLSNVFIKLEGRRRWESILEEPIMANAIVWETLSIPDGRYRLKVTVDDSPSNFGGRSFKTSRVSEVFTVDNTPPVVDRLHAVVTGRRLEIRGAARDSGSRILNCEYSLNADYYRALEPSDGIFDQSEEDFRVDVELPRGKKARTVAVKVFDEFGNVANARIFICKGKGSLRSR